MFLLLAMSYFSFELLQYSKERQLTVAENAEVKSIKYGLLSVHSWKRQVSEIITEKVKNFKITDANRSNIRRQVIEVLNEVFDEVDRVISQRESGLNFLERLAKRAFETLIFDVKDLRNSIPEFADIIVEGLSNQETREQLRQYIQDRLTELLYQTVGQEDLSNIKVLEDKYDCIGIAGCSTITQTKLVQYDNLLEQYCWWILGLALLAFLIVILGNRNISTVEYLILVGVCVVLLIGGITNPEY